MTVAEMVLRSMNKGEYRTHYKKGNANYFLRNTEDTYYLEKISRSSGSTVCCGNEEKVLSYIEENKMKEIGLLHI